jgi:hypothetical protein
MTSVAAMSSFSEILPGGYLKQVQFLEMESLTQFAKASSSSA